MTVEFFLAVLPLYLVPLLLLGCPVWYFGRKRVQWNHWDFAVGVLPLVVWTAAMMVNGTGKSLSNLVEIAYLGCAVAIALNVRLLAGSRVNQRLLAAGLLIAVCLMAVALWAFVPALPE
jgi:hypothetical protein